MSNEGGGVHMVARPPNTRHDYCCKIAIALTDRVLSAIVYINNAQPSGWLTRTPSLCEEPSRGVGNGCAPTADSTRVKGKTLDLRSTFPQCDFWAYRNFHFLVFARSPRRNPTRIRHKRQN